MAQEAEELFRMHPASRGLDDEAVQKIAAAMEVVTVQPGETVQRAHDPITDIRFVVHGRLRTSIIDVTGVELIARHLVSGAQFGGIAAALGEPTPLTCVAEDPSTLLKLNYEAGLKLTAQFDQFRVNLTRLIAGSIKQIIFDHRHPRRPQLVAFFHQSGETRPISQRVLSRLVELGETPGLLSDDRSGAALSGVENLISDSEHPGQVPDDIIARTAEWLKRGRVFVDASTGIQAERAARTLERCQQVFWCVTPGNWKESLARLQELENRAPGWKDKVCIVWLLRRGEQAPLARELRQLSGYDLKLTFDPPSENTGPVWSNGIERLVQMVRGIRIGIALGGGAARGMAHLGVLKTLEQNGIFVDMIAGTSAGAMTGMLYAAGLDMDYASARFAHDLKPSWLFRKMPRGEQWYLLHKYRTRRFDPMLRKYMANMQMAQLALPMHAVAVDLVSGQTVVRNSGDAVHAILESINLPGLSSPIIRAGQSLVDGGLINNIPADVLVEHGCNFVIAVSVTAKMEQEFVTNRPDTPLNQMRPASTIQTVLRSLLVQSTSINAVGVQPADIVIEPDVTSIDLTSFTRTPELAAIGESATQDSIGQIRQLLQRLDADLFAVR